MKKLKLITILITILALTASLFGCFYVGDTAYDYEEQGNANEPILKPVSETIDNEIDSVSDEVRTKEQQAFSEFINTQFKESIESSYMATHIYYIDPEAGGLDLNNIDVSLGLAPTPESRKEERDSYEDISKEFVKFNRSLLTPEQQIEYDSFKWELTVAKLLSQEKFDYYEQLFAPPSSLDADLVSCFSEWDIRHERDAEDIIKFLNSIPAYVDSSIEYAKIQQEKELFMTNFDEVIKGCNDVLKLGTKSIILTNLLGEIDELEIDQKKKDEFKVGIEEAFKTSYLPSFQKIADAMEEMRNGYNNTEGYAAFPYGREYFEANMMLASGTLYSVPEIEKYLEKKSDLYLNKLFKVYSKYPEEVDAYYDDSAPSSGFKTYKEILDYNKTAMLKDFPEVKNLEYNIEDASPEEKLDEKNIAAYFLIPPLDGDRLQQMRVEPSGRDVESLDTYETVSHEGFPGHMYHYAYMYSNIDSAYIKTLGVESFVEGYAVYAQTEALNYLKDMPIGYIELQKASTGLSYSDYSLADIGINYHGWDKDEMMSFFTDAGYSLDSSSAQEIYDFLRTSPCSYIPYGYGFLRLSDIRLKAQAALGDKFDALSFNTALITPGPVPFSIIENSIAKYIEENK